MAATHVHVTDESPLTAQGVLVFSVDSQLSLEHSQLINLIIINS